MKTRRILRRSLAACVAAVLVLGPAVAIPAEEVPGIEAFAAATEPPVFDTAAAAINRFKALVGANDFDGLARLLGLDPQKLAADGSAKDTFQEIREGAARQVVVEDLGDRQLLDIGERLWPFPFPIVKGEDGKWAFDTDAGLQEIVNRRIGENELEAIATMRAYVNAQEEYASQDRSGEGVLEYAQRMVSTPGKTDGLYWPSDQGDGESPAGDFADQAALEKARQGDGYFGYRFRILTGQGDNVAGGRYDYVINGHMIAGFALIAWPVKYRETGVNTFLVSKAGIVYQADLGRQTETIANGIKRFNPDKNWSIVTE
ncbi:DUF2950 domain-containing protein [Mesorhizobium sp. ANAO-SY3R2]|uniref:DUF2950 domain-containing protein n=1 Tax=Mesorhizobium sp. ANAO-SY3R2 TaxID=3166644 RepID=UPI00366A6542